MATAPTASPAAPPLRARLHIDATVGKAGVWAWLLNEGLAPGWYPAFVHQPHTSSDVPVQIVIESQHSIKIFFPGHRNSTAWRNRWKEAEKVDPMDTVRCIAPSPSPSPTTATGTTRWRTVRHLANPQNWNMLTSVAVGIVLGSVLLVSGVRIHLGKPNSGSGGTTVKQPSAVGKKTITPVTTPTPTATATVTSAPPTTPLANAASTPAPPPTTPTTTPPAQRNPPPRTYYDYSQYNDLESFDIQSVDGETVTVLPPQNWYHWVGTCWRNCDQGNTITIVVPQKNFTKEVDVNEFSMVTIPGSTWVNNQPIWQLKFSCPKGSCPMIHYEGMKRVVK